MWKGFRARGDYLVILKRGSRSTRRKLNPQVKLAWVRQAKFYPEMSSSKNRRPNKKKTAFYYEKKVKNASSFFS